MKILYFMHVDWNWIKQRPHYLAEELSNDNFVYTVYDKMHDERKLTNNSYKIKNGPAPKPFYRIRGEFRSKLIFHINQVRRKNLIKRICKEKNIDTILIPYPTMVLSIPKNFKGRIIYDCMDDHYAMASIVAKEIVDRCERILLHRADEVLFTSIHLQKEVLRRCDLEEIQSHLVRNGYNGFGVTEYQQKVKINADAFNLCYFGTISTWFDWDMVKYALDSCSQLYFHVIGPNSTGEVLPEHPRIIYYGSVEHAALASMTKDMDAFVMPFILNDIILSVDPVKIYEYIYLGKNILAPFYEEIERFDRFVNFYKTKEDFVSLINSLAIDNTLKYTNDEKEIFLSNNTWKVRAEQINRICDHI